LNATASKAAFPDIAFEAVMGRDLGAHFPVHSRRPVSDQVPGYNKNMNVDWRG
jgi:hypothetical protein